MKLNRIKEVLGKFSISHGLRLVNQVGNRFIINLNSEVPVEDSEAYDIYIPIEENNGAIRYNETTLLNNPILGVLSKTIQKEDVISPAEAWYIMKRNPTNWDQMMQPVYGAWIASKQINVAWFSKELDDAWYTRLSECMEVELVRGLTLDYQRSKEAGFSGMTSTNGSLQHLLSEYAMFGIPVSKHRMGTVIFNRPIRQEETSKLIDLSCIPQDTDAPSRMSVVYGVQVEDNKLVKKKKLQNSAYTLSNVPFREILNEKRMVIQRASSQALPLHYSEKAFVRKPQGANIPGINVITLRDKNVPIDSMIVSESMAKRMIAVKEIEMNYILPHNTKVVNAFVRNQCSKNQTKPASVQVLQA